MSGNGRPDSEVLNAIRKTMVAAIEDEEKPLRSTLATRRLTPLGGQDLAFRQISIEDESVLLSRAFLGHHLDGGGLL